MKFISESIRFSLAAPIWRRFRLKWSRSFGTLKSAACTAAGGCGVQEQNLAKSCFNDRLVFVIKQPLNGSQLLLKLPLMGTKVD